MKKILIIHGYGGNLEYLWFPWIKKEFEASGYLVFTPVLPKPFLPALDEQLNSLKQTIETFGEDDIIITHSGGARTAAHLILQNKKKLNRLICFAPVLSWDFFTSKFIAKSEQRAADNEAAKNNWETMLSYKDDRVNLSLMTGYVPVTAIFSNDDQVSLAGSDIYLTIDYNIQFQAEALLKQTADKLGINAGQIIVMKPDTG